MCCKANCLISLIHPNTLQGILRNISLQLPEGYELIAGTRTDRLYLYYELVQVSVIGDAHIMKLIFNVPLKSAISQFTLYKVVALPTRVSKTNFFQYSIDYSYFGLENSRHDYLLFKETDPANMAVYSSKTLNCLSSIFFQTSTYNSICRRHLHVNLRTPILQKHKSLWLYYFPEQRQVTLRCLENNTWMTRTETLAEGGLILNECFIVLYSNRRVPNTFRVTREHANNTGYTPSLHT